MSPEKKAPKQWSTPSEVMRMHRLKLKKKALQARMNKTCVLSDTSLNKSKCGSSFDNVLASSKRKNPFLKDTIPSSKRSRVDQEGILNESTDATLFKLLNNTDSKNTTASTAGSFTSFNNILSRIDTQNSPQNKVEIVKATGKKWLPIDWTLKSKMRMISMKPFPWNQKLKISEEASGITGFARCVDGENSQINLDASPNAKFHQCCLIWQQPVIPWLTLFPRNSTKNSSSALNLYSNSAAKNSLFQAWTDSFRSLYQLIRTRQCPYFYMCANSFTVLFRAAGICGYTDVHVFITPTTRGLRQLLKQEEIEFTMPLKKQRNSDQGYETLDSESGQTEESQTAESIDKTICDNNKTDDDEREKERDSHDEDDDALDEKWLKKMGISAEDIKQINYTQSRIQQKTECQVDNSDLSLVLIEGVEVNSLFNFLINCKSTIATTGSLAGVPPTLLAPVAFHGATLNSLKVRENKIHCDGQDFFCLELLGPILPNTVHNLFSINSSDHSMTATFNNLSSTEAFSKVTRNNPRKSDTDRKGTAVFGKENLSDCGLSTKMLKHFCSADNEIVGNIECLKYSGDDSTFMWT